MRGTKRREPQANFPNRFAVVKSIIRIILLKLQGPSVDGPGVGSKVEKLSLNGTHPVRLRRPPLRWRGFSEELLMPAWLAQQGDENLFPL